MVFKIESTSPGLYLVFFMKRLFSKLWPLYQLWDAPWGPGHFQTGPLFISRPLATWKLKGCAVASLQVFFESVGKISVNRGRHNLGYQHRNRMSCGNFEARLRMGSLSSTPSKKHNKMVTRIFACNCNPPSLAGQSLITDHPLSLSGGSSH